jgi:hypothetical protein
MDARHSEGGQDAHDHEHGEELEKGESGARAKVHAWHN